MYLTGSRAASHFIGCETAGKDWDVVLTDEERWDIEPSREIDICPSKLFSLQICEEFASDIVVDTPVGPATVLGPLGLMLLKRSHLHRTLGFEKHIRHYHELKAYCSEFEKTERYSELLRLRTKATKALYPDRTPSLKKTKSDFFDDFVTKVYEHDDIHYATCYGSQPIYERLKTDNDLVWCSKSLWELLSHEDKVKCVQEEAFVITLERFIIPQLVLDKPHMPVTMGYSKAVSKICTTLTSGWFRDFAIENWPEVMSCDQDFYQKFLNKFHAGKFNESFRTCSAN